ncbi:MAG: hypothetical protein CSA89_01075 [Bacteroidales bacterium]|nr:MAG: hypothetical protein CSA89_01075 [Bacteroidales bacterium]
MPQNNKWKAYIAITLSIIFWGVSLVWTKNLLYYNFNVFVIVTLRVAIAFLVLFSIALFTNNLEKVARKDYKLFFLSTLFQPFLYFICENYGLKYVDASYVALFDAIIPICVPFGLYFFYRERLKKNVLIGVAISITGILFISLNQHSSQPTNMFGVFLMIMVLLTASGYNIVLYKMLYYKPITIVMYQNLLATFMYLPLLILVKKEEYSSMIWNFTSISSILMLAILCSALACLFYSYSAKKIKISRTNVFTNAIPLVTMTFACMMGQESMTTTKIIGMVIVISGVAFSQMIEKRNKKSATNKNLR